LETEYKIYIEAESNIEDIRIVEQNLSSFNRQFTDPDNYKPLNIFIRNTATDIIGGLLGETYWNWLHIRVLWIDEKYRRQGLGKKLLCDAENEAISRGCKSVHLDTHDFQAEKFYKNRGYVVFGVLDDLPQGKKRLYMKKVLQ
jgi:ribosomal protein S18 acetylase RimI-like enzyme